MKLVFSCKEIQSTSITDKKRSEEDAHEHRAVYELWNNE